MYQATSLENRLIDLLNNTPLDGISKFAIMDLLADREEDSNSINTLPLLNRGDSYTKQTAGADPVY